ncbi:antifreeze protein [Litorisediminicola beolgyonensis]|uniref:Antifreeze protein n=1 Tax=Litorisediminicola beolgyonensis TaxID=1173614 RepID=A0ABW3ZNU2_9RHOB
MSFGIYAPWALGIGALRSWSAAALLAVEAQQVIGLRIAGLAGFWKLPAGESSRMVSEKLSAFPEAGQALGQAMLSGTAPMALYGTWSAPLMRRAQANRKRLGRGAAKQWGGSAPRHRR